MDLLKGISLIQHVSKKTLQDYVLKNPPNAVKSLCCLMNFGLCFVVDWYKAVHSNYGRFPTKPDTSAAHSHVQIRPIGAVTCRYKHICEHWSVVLIRLCVSRYFDTTPSRLSPGQKSHCAQKKPFRWFQKSLAILVSDMNPSDVDHFVLWMQKQWRGKAD